MDFSVLQQPGGSLSLDKTQGIEADSLLQTFVRNLRDDVDSNACYRWHHKIHGLHRALL